jgi:FkbM family methyltransferase
MGKDVSVEILRYLNYDNGTYLETGSNDGIFQSNTVKLELEKNWSGILIEASPYAYNECLKNRSQEKNIIIHGALVSDTYEGDTIKGDFNGHPMGSIGGRRLSNQQNANIEVPAYTLTEILSQLDIDKIDIMFIDVEGWELFVLSGLDFETWRPSYFLIEWNLGEEDLFPFMNSKGYDCVENLSKFNATEDVGYPGTHQDYLFKLRE